MELLRKVAEFTSSRKDLIQIYKIYVRSVVEQSCVVWHSSLTVKNSTDIERIQRVAIKIITKGMYSYSEGLTELNLPTLKERREILCARFANKCLMNKKTSSMFKLTTSKFKMNLQHQKRYKETYAQTNRLYKSAIPHMQRLLNKQHNKTQKLMKL